MASSENIHQVFIDKPVAVDDDDHEKTGADVIKISDAKQMEKLAYIAEVIEIMEDTHKNKDWILQQIKQNRVKVQARTNMNSVAILKTCPLDFILHLLNHLKFVETEGFEGPPPLTVTYHWFFTDIVASSDPTITTNEQARKIIVLNKLIDRTAVFRQRDPDSTLVLPTGDGMAIGFSDSPEKPLLLALEVHKDLYKYNMTKRAEKDRIYLRIGLDTGPVYLIKDLNGQENVWGPGIIMARRVMDLARDMNIIASARIANDIRTLRPEYKSILHPIGDYSIKHGEKILIYNIFGENFGNKKSPKDSKVQKSIAAQETQKTSSKFQYLGIEVLLDVRDPSTMLTHHTMIWNMLNISSEPVDRIFYYLDGDVPRNFPDLNVTVKDEDDKELDIMSLNVNKPTHKEFNVRLRKPLQPGQRRRLTKLEYDWEEPDRHYFYRFASNCKRFDYKFTAPSSLQINQKVVKVDVETGDKIIAPIPPTVRFLEDVTEVNWSGTNFEAHDAYRFDW